MSEIVRSRLAGLRSLTPARVLLPTVGNSLATSEVLAFQQAHALARDAVHAPLDCTAFAVRMRDELPLLAAAGIEVIQLNSNAHTRSSYLRHPQLGRSLEAASAARLERGDYDLAIVIADGLSSKAVERNAIPIVGHLVPMLLDQNWLLAPITLIEQGRVAAGDPVGDGLGARCSLVLIGERPGLSCASSLGGYITWAPHPSKTDADRVCVSNMHEAGLRPPEAAQKLFTCLMEARVRQRTGTALGDSRSLPAS